MDEALNNIKDAIKGWLKVDTEQGKFNSENRDEENEIFLGEVLV